MRHFCTSHWQTILIQESELVFGGSSYQGLELAVTGHDASPLLVCYARMHFNTVPHSSAVYIVLIFPVFSDGIPCSSIMCYLIYVLFVLYYFAFELSTHYVWFALLGQS